MRSSKELSSSPDEPPSVNMPPFFFKGDGLRWSWGLILWGSGANLGCDRYEEEIWDGENPCTTLGDLIRCGREGRMPEEETLVSDASCWGTSLSLPSGAVVEQDSVD